MNPREILGHPELSRKVFFPRREPVDGPFLVAVAGATLACARARSYPDADAGTLLHFHGNGEVVADYLNAGFAAMARDDLRMNLCLAEYRGYGGSTGTPSLPDLLDDAVATVRALGPPMGRVAVYGRSLGSLAAIEVAARHPDIAALILESGLADPLELIRRRARPEGLDATGDDLCGAVDALLDHRRKLSGYAGPLLVIHARRDGLIDVSHGERLHAWGAAPARDKRLVVFDRGDHNSVLAVNQKDYENILKEFLGGLGLWSARGA